ncbi:MAG: DUF1800 domain-containing protein [Casimicrobiaceae bacterium]
MPSSTFVAAAIRTLVAVVACASVPAPAASSAVLGYDDARHLLARTGFGPTDAEVRVYAPLTRADAVAKLLRETRTTAVTPPPASALDTSPLRPPRGENVPEAERKAFQQQQVREGLELRAWWVQEMLATPSPLTERMTLFWHNHFVSAQQKVRIARLMYRQNVTLREYALGNFGAFLHAIAKDPAMIVYLDAVQNRKGAPNENFAREVMELFTLGEGHYTEQDVKEAARAFTGWSLERETGTFVFRSRLHDDGTKVVLAKAGRFDGDAVLDILLARLETAEFLTTKLWREFVSPDPDPVEVARIARRFRESNYDIKVALKELLAGDAFYAPGNRGVLVKSPTELVVGTLRQLDLAPGTTLPFAVAAAGMGQNLMSPPNVKGWPGGETWINSTTLLARKQYLDRVTRAGEPPPLAMIGASGGEANEKTRQQRFVRQMERGLASLDFDSARWIAQFSGVAPAERARAAQQLLLATAPQQRPDYDADSRTLVHAIVLDAAYQLK